jgi:hypothetical protein
MLDSMSATQLLEAMADVESRIAVIYERFATQFCDAGNVSDLWVSMGREELHHADLLSQAAGAAGDAAAAAGAVVHVEKLQAIVGQCEAEQAALVHLQDALRVTADLEEAEATHLHASLTTLGNAGRSLLVSPVMEHHCRRLLEHAIRLFGTPELQQRLAWRRFRE